MTTTPAMPQPTLLAGPRRGVRRALRGDAGAFSLEMSILFPAVLALVVAVVQYGLWFHARSVALAAAQEGVVAAATYRAGPGDGVQQATAFLQAHGNDTLLGTTVTQAVADDSITVVVTGRSLSLMPGVSGPAVRQSAQAPVERFTTRTAP